MVGSLCSEDLNPGTRARPKLHHLLRPPHNMATLTVKFPHTDGGERSPPFTTAFVSHVLES